MNAMANIYGDKVGGENQRGKGRGKGRGRGKKKTGEVEEL